MKWVKSYKKYKESLLINIELSGSDVMESLNILYDVLLNSIKAEELNIFDTLELPDTLKDNSGDIKLDIDSLSDNTDFINSLTKKANKKSQLVNTKDLSTFLTKPCKYMFIYKQDQNELENPIFIILQIENDKVKLYKINGSVDNFLNKLSSKTIEVVDGDQNYIYTTSNVGEWELQNSDKENDVYKKVFRKEELQKLLDEREVKLNII